MLLWPERFDAAFLILSLVLLRRCALFLVDLVLAANRSRSDEMGHRWPVLPGRIRSAGRAAEPERLPRSTGGGGAGRGRGWASVRLGDRDSTPPFGILVPTIALGLNGLWGVRWGLFPVRDDAT